MRGRQPKFVGEDTTWGVSDGLGTWVFGSGSTPSTRVVASALFRSRTGKKSSVQELQQGDCSRMQEQFTSAMRLLSAVHGRA